jgi:integrase
MKPMSETAINAAYKRLGIDTREELTGHGWRAVARTLLHERLGYPAEVIEHQLAHAVPDTLGRAYNRTRFLAERRKMMQEWANYLDALRDGAQVIPMRRSG